VPSAAQCCGQTLRLGGVQRLADHVRHTALAGIGLDLEICVSGIRKPDFHISKRWTA
jgi:hypothetical protein